jgi:hypothetical protein
MAADIIEEVRPHLSNRLHIWGDEKQNTVSNIYNVNFLNFSSHDALWSYQFSQYFLITENNELILSSCLTPMSSTFSKLLWAIPCYVLPSTQQLLLLDQSGKKLCFTEHQLTWKGPS